MVIPRASPLATIHPPKPSDSPQRIGPASPLVGEDTSFKTEKQWRLCFSLRFSVRRCTRRAFASNDAPLERARFVDSGRYSPLQDRTAGRTPLRNRVSGGTKGPLFRRPSRVYPAGPFLFWGCLAAHTRSSPHSLSRRRTASGSRRFVCIHHTPPKTLALAGGACRRRFAGRQATGIPAVGGNARALVRMRGVVP